MNIKLTLLFLFLIQLVSLGQPVFPRYLEAEEFPGKNITTETIAKYDFNKTKKKAFLFFDVKTEPLAQVMYNGCNFAFDKDLIDIFPVFFTGQLTTKKGKNFETVIPFQLFKSPSKSCFKLFNITEEDLPLLVVYSSKNQLCGYSKTTEDISTVYCTDDDSDKKILRLKIMAEEKNKYQVPYSEQSVFIIATQTNDTIAKVKTNKYGDFNAEIKDLNQDYLISVNEKNKDLNFIVSTQAGVEVGKFNATEKGFVYRLLQTELVKLPDIKTEDDVELRFTNSKNKAEKEFVLTENLFYPLGKSKITKSSKLILDKMKQVLLANPEFHLDVISHTDSQGEEKENLKLSLKRSQAVVDYFKSKGINKSKLTAQGKGESQIRNRCLNNIDCSDLEHEYNRRTEFKFSKQ